MEKERESSQKKNPRETANIFSIAFFWWMNSLMRQGYKNDLEQEDLFEHLKADASQELGDRLAREWDKELQWQRVGQEKAKEYEPSLMKAMVRQFGPFYLFLGLFTFLEECIVRIYQPIFMGWMMEYFVAGSGVTETDAYLYGTGVVAMAAAYTFTHHAYFFGVMHTGMRMRIAACSMLYKKALKLSNSSLGKTTVGQMVNLLSNDVNRFDQSVLFFHYLWAGPLQLAIITYLLWQKIGPSSLTGTILLILFVPVQTWVGEKIGKLRVSTAAKTDIRLRLMNEIVNGMKVIKMYTWEKAFTNLVQDARKKEISVIRNTSYYRSFNFSFFFTASRFILLCTFLVYGFTGEILTAEKAFLCLSLYNTVRLSMTLFFPFAITMMGELKVSVSRIQDFLLLEERDAHNNLREFSPNNSQIAVSVSKMTGKWIKEENENTLTDINITVRPGQLIAIIGPVGSGKSSIIQGILGELPLSSGEIHIHGDLSYSPQEPWVFAGSVKDNILFGKPFDKKLYSKVVQACALETDFVQWPHGDRTLVGERGVALSGGQKARVTLARAVYRSADCYLLDDPLSAVDSHVGNHLFDNCIRGYLKSSAVILVTHQLQYLQQSDLIIVLKNGKIQETGDFQHLVKNGLDFSAFLAPEETKEGGGERGAGGAGAETEDDEDDDEMDDAFDLRQIALFRNKTRSMSIASDVSAMSGIREDLNQMSLLTDKEDKDPEATKEGRGVGSVNFQLYLRYFRSGGNWCAVIFMLTVNILCQALYSASDIWITYWTNIEEVDMDNLPIPPPILANNQSLRTTLTVTDTEFVSPDHLSDHYFNLGIYAAIVFSLVVTSMIRTVYFFVICMKASVNMHNSMFSKIVRVPCRFFDTNPVGRILNRFSKDMGSMDEQLPPAFFDAFTIALNICGIMAVIFSVRPLVIVPTLVLGIIFFLLRKFYMRTARDIKRLEGIARSPVFSQLSTSLHGLTSIRAFSAQDMLRREFDHYQDVHTSTWFAFISATRWFGVWLDWIVVVYLGCVVYSFLIMGGDIVGGDVGLAISSCITLTGMLQWGVRQSAEVETLMTAVERVMEYSALEEEAPSTNPAYPPPPRWPADGVIEFKDVYLSYDKNEKAVLKGLNFKTGKHEKVGIVGRTGAGKSSLVAALFRLAEPTGTILIDGVEALRLGLNDLRSKLSIIPQDPLLFTGSLRRNLDPFSQYSDSQVWGVLQEVHLAEAVQDLKNGLDTEVSEGGSNFSLGQRQLICLARAVLRQNSILVLDEATANVDPATDQLIQEQIRSRFANCTVLTIAHRLHTIMDSDRILVLSDGKVVEFDTPYNLLNRPGGVLTELVEQTGEASRDRLKEVALQAHTAAIAAAAASDDNSSAT